MVAPSISETPPPTVVEETATKQEAATQPEVVSKKIRKSAAVSHPSATVKPASTSVAGLPAATSAGSATLDIEVDHKFAEAKLSIWVDDRLSYTRTLEGTDKKHLVLFHHVQGHEIHAMPIPAGSHRLRVQVTSGDNSSDQSVTGDFSSGSEKLLQVSVDKRGVMNLNLE